jgi:hypothetical protein
MQIARLLFGCLVGLGLIAAARADEAAPARIGRLSAVVGGVQYRSPTGDWSKALVNEPIAEGVGVRSARDATAEFDIAGARVALAGASETQIVRLDGEFVEIAVAQGRVGVHLQGGVANTVEIDLPKGGVWLAAPGDYDIVASDAQAAPRIAVFAGKALVGGGLTDGNIAAAAADAFDAAWRSEAKVDDVSAPVSPTLAGVALLAANGDWGSDDTAGQVWSPKGMPDNWAPFRYGQWRYLPPWGWSWIDAAEWGFAPSHYGAWERINERWAWVPGSPSDAPVYSPARVAFLGTPGIGLSRPGNDGAAVAWFPLAPGDDGDTHFRNRRSASVVPRAVFAGGQPVAASLLDLPEWRLDNAPVIFAGLGIAPIGDGGSGFVAEAAASPVMDTRVVEVPLRVVEVKLETPAPRPVVVARIAPKKVVALVAPPPRRWHVATVIVVHPAHPTHNRPHLAAARGGA